MLVLLRVYVVRNFKGVGDTVGGKEWGNGMGLEWSGLDERH